MFLNGSCLKQKVVGTSVDLSESIVFFQKKKKYEANSSDSSVSK